MKILFIGGTGLISSACSELAVERGQELFLLNRGRFDRYASPAGAHALTGDIHGDEAALVELLAPYQFDVVVDWLAYTPADIERDLRLFGGRTGQFVFISSASAYQKPPNFYVITEKTPLENPFWDYSRNKIACEKRLMRAFKEQKFPVTIVRPSLTYGPSQIPLCVGSWQHPYTVVDRMKRGKRIIVPGDGTSLWVLTWNGDFAKGFLGLLGNPKAIGEAYHITADEVLTWNSIYSEVGWALGLDPEIVHIPSDLIAAYDPEAFGSLIGDKINSAVFDNRKIKKLVPDFTCTVPWSDGLRRSLAWFDADPVRRTIDEKANATWDKILAAYGKAFPQG
ncbi:MAG TPA: SDR family oxidoreductase [Anaerolineales bacterium]|nr:SDR family oxidoreductase [Anaerolineales bacterium]